jgi:GNAT superfamily N-acetyltransferase
MDTMVKKNKLKFKIRPIEQNDREWVRKFIIKNWGAEKVVAHRQIFYPHKLPGFVAIKGNRYLGLVTYRIGKNNLEIISMNAIIQGKGIGTALLRAVEKVGQKLKLKKIRLITTNDNVDALRFYQKRGFSIVAIHRNALEFSRKLKPEIPLIGNYGIPLRDEIELELKLRK